MNCSSLKLMWEKLPSVLNIQNRFGRQELLQDKERFDKERFKRIDGGLCFNWNLLVLISIIKLWNVDARILYSLSNEYKHFISAWESLDVKLRTRNNLASRFFPKKKGFYCVLMWRKMLPIQTKIRERLLGPNCRIRKGNEFFKELL